MPMVQVFAPDGTLGDIPYDRLHDALGQGAKIAAKVKAPDGTVGFVPGDRVPDALKAGGQRVPLDGNDADGGKPGFWSQAYSKAASMVPSKEESIRALGGSGVTAYQLATNPKQAIGQALQQTPGLQQAQEYLRSRGAGESIPRAALNTAGTMVGVNPAAQEAAAAQGNTSGVLADAAVPAAAAIAGPLVGEGIGALKGPALDALSQYKPQVQGTADFLMHPEQIPGKTVAKLADLIPDTPEAAAAKQRVIEEAQAAEINKARAMQDIQLRRESMAKATAERAAAKADAAARQPVPLTDSPNYPKWKADQAAAAQAVKDAAKAEAAARQPVPVSQSPYYAQNQAAIAADEAARKPVPVSQSPYYTQNQAAAAEAARPASPLSSIYGPASPSAEEFGQGAKLSDLVGERPSGITVVPEPRALFTGETPNYMASVPRGTLQDLALAGKPGAAKQIQQLGQQVLYAPSGAGISNVKSAVALRDLLEAKPSMTLNPVGAGGARPIVNPESQFESSFGPEHQEVGDLAEWETGNREGVKVGSDLDKAAKSMFGGKSFDSLTQAQKAHILRIAQTQVAVP